jgi:hypothetical protein
MSKRKASEISVIPLWILYRQVVIDHKEEDEKSNNTVGNLDPTTGKKNSQKSRRLNPERYKGTGVIPIQGRKKGETEWKDYPGGAIQAGEELELYKANITNVCKGRYKQYRGYEFQYKDDPDLKDENGDDEIWVMNTHVGILVSNMGRVKRYVKTKGSKCESKFYYVVNVKGKHYLVHRLVCQAFKWHVVQRKFEKSKYTDIYSFWKKLHVDHIDRNKTNNHIDNLQPLTSKEHADKTDHNDEKRGKTMSRPFLGKKEGQDWKDATRYEYGTKKAARELGDISTRSIHKCLKDKKTRKGYQFKYLPDPDLKDEIWKDIPQKFFKPGSVKGWKVSNKGRVQYKRRKKYRGADHKKYKRFGNNILVHRAVAAAFMEDKIMEVLREEGLL